MEGTDGDEQIMNIGLNKSKKGIFSWLWSRFCSLSKMFSSRKKIRCLSLSYLPNYQTVYEHFKDETMLLFPRAWQKKWRYCVQDICKISAFWMELWLLFNDCVEHIGFRKRWNKNYLYHLFSTWTVTAAIYFCQHRYKKFDNVDSNRCQARSLRVETI